MPVRSTRTTVLTILLAAAVAAATVQQTTARADSGTAAELWTESSYTSVFADSGPSADSGHAVVLDTARNDDEAAQVVLRPSRPLTITGVDFTELRAGRHTIAASDQAYNFVGYQHLDANSAFGAQDVNPVTRTAPADFPDRLLNDRTITVPADATQPIWIRVHVPAKAAAASYTGAVIIVTDHGRYRVPISVDVRNVTIPPASDGAFTAVLWQLFTGNISWDEGAGDTVKLFYGFDRYSPRWWTLIDNVAEVMKRYRSNELAVPVVRLLIDGGSTVDADGHYSFNWSRFDEVVERFIRHGGVKRLQGFWQSGRQGSENAWRTEVISTDPSTGKAIRSFPLSDSATTDGWIDQYIPALRDHIKAKGWEPIFSTQISDEPGTDVDLKTWKSMATKIRARWPDIRIGDTIPHEPVATELAPLNDIVIPEELNYNTNPAPYDAERAKGKDLWLYNCVIPVGNYLNRFVDQPEWDQRLTMWYAYSRNMNGYLHWAMNNWQYTMELQGTKGDGYIVRPDTARTTIEVSPRYESLRDGIEDWEVLHILGSKQPELARDLARSLTERADKYSVDIGYMQRIRAMMLDAAAGKPVISDDLARGRDLIRSANTVQVDLGRQAQIDGVLLQWAGDAPAGYRVQLSYDGRHWATATDLSSVNGTVSFAGVNGHARYLRVTFDPATGTAPTDLRVAGRPRSEDNLAGGRSYRLTHPDGSAAPPSGRFPDAGLEATDGVLADAWDDGKAFGYELTDGQQINLDLTIDLGAARQVGFVRTHAYEEYPAYRPDTVAVATSIDGEHFTERGTLSAVNGKSQVWYDFWFGRQRARYVRLSLDKTGTAKGTGMFIDDVEVTR